VLNGVDLLAQLAHDVDHNQAIPTERFAIALLKAKISYIPNILQSPAPNV
jgi:small conductance mechanosensitive channel